MVIIVIILYIAIILLICTNFHFSRMVGIYRILDLLRARPQETLPIENILGKLALVPVGDTGTIPYNMPRPWPRGTYANKKKGKWGWLQDVVSC